MSLNKLALIRYKTIDACLQNRHRRWTLEMLIEAVGDALYEYEGIRTGVSRRTIQTDIQNMRSDKLGYNAPIAVIDKKYYTYEDPKFSIHQSGVNEADIQKVSEITDMLKYFSGFSFFGEIQELVAQLESKIFKKQSKSYNLIQFETNPLLKGIDLIQPIFQAIREKTVLAITYQSFNATAPNTNHFSGYVLKEFRNRWFLLAQSHHRKTLDTLALDRMVKIEPAPQETFKQPAPDLDFDAYYDNLIGVTKNPASVAQKVILEISPAHSPYILTKPFHASQEILRPLNSEQPDKGAIISVQVVLNFELEREILGFGEDMKVLSPRYLTRKIQNRLQKAARAYDLPNLNQLF